MNCIIYIVSRIFSERFPLFLQTQLATESGFFECFHMTHSYEQPESLPDQPLCHLRGSEPLFNRVTQVIPVETSQNRFWEESRFDQIQEVSTLGNQSMSFASRASSGLGNTICISLIVFGLIVMPSMKLVRKFDFYSH